MDEQLTKKFRTLTIGLIFSGALNIGLVAAFIAMMAQDQSGGAKIHAKKAAEEQKIGNLAVLETMSKLSFRELVALLTNRELVEEGYSKRDLAVSSLTAIHHFNLEKALSSDQLQKRVIAMGENKQIELYPGLTDEQFEAVIRFAYQEKWPLTAKGLFALLKKLPSPRDESLEQAFYLTPEFYALQALFQKTDAAQEPSVLLALVSEGSWELLDQFAKEQAQMLEMSADKRRRLLLSYLAHRSATAARLLLSTDAPFALKRFDDQGILNLVNLSEKGEEAKQFCIALLQSPRSDAVWHAAIKKLYEFEGETLPESYELRSAASRFAPVKAVEESKKPVVNGAPPKSASARFHTVQEGESLWKIARQYKVKVDEIVKINDLEKDRLFPGMTIKIPD